MNLDQAQQLISQLGVELGGSTQTYQMDERGEIDLSFQGQMPVHLRYHEGTLILSSIVATDVDLQNPELFPNLMDYQFMGMRTFGCVLSWNSGSDCLLLSRQLHGEPDARQLAHELSILLKASLQVSDELKPLIDGEFSLLEQPAAPADSLLPPQMMRA